MMMSDKLPRRVIAIVDRHGRTRHRYRRGPISAYINHPFPSAEFYARYAELELLDAPPERETRPKVKGKRTVDHLHRQFIARPKWHAQAITTRRVYGRVLDRFCDTIDSKGRRYGDRPVAAVTVAWLDNVLGRMADRPGAATTLRKVLRRLFGYAVKLGWRTDNPAAATDSFASGPGFHTWTDDEIAQFRAHHAYGTMARLTLELALNTAARRCNIATIERSHIEGGKIAVEHAKGGNATLVELLPETQRAMAAMPAQPIRFLIVTQYGKPFTVAGLGNKMRQWCNEAGLPNCSMHGLRKAISRMLAEAGATDAQGQAVTGHKRDKTFAHYRAAADRTHLAEAAMSNLRAANLSNRKATD